MKLALSLFTSTITLLFGGMVHAESCLTYNYPQLKYTHFITTVASESDAEKGQTPRSYRILKVEEASYGESLKIEFSLDEDLNHYDDTSIGEVWWPSVVCPSMDRYLGMENHRAGKTFALFVNGTPLELGLLRLLLDSGVRYSLVYLGHEKLASGLYLTKGVEDLGLRYENVKGPKNNTILSGDDLRLELALHYNRIETDLGENLRFGVLNDDDSGYPMINLLQVNDTEVVPFDKAIEHLKAAATPNVEEINKALEFDIHSHRELQPVDTDRLSYGYYYLVALKRFPTPQIKIRYPTLGSLR